MINVILAEDHKIVRDGLKTLLEMDSKIQVVGEVENGRQALDIMASGQQVDVVLADSNLPELDSVSLISELKAHSPSTQIIMLSMLDNEQYVARAFLAGASGYVLKSIMADELLFSLKHVNMGGKYLCSELSLRLLEKLLNPSRNTVVLENATTDFSMREIEILQLLSEGFTNQEIAEKLFISKRTVEAHRQNMIGKAEVKNTAALIRYSIINGVVH